jgi:hypothetical protein
MGLKLVLFVGCVFSHIAMRTRKDVCAGASHGRKLGFGSKVAWRDIKDGRRDFWYCYFAWQGSVKIPWPHMGL